MTGPNRSPKTKADALEEEELLTALAASGYPLEIRLLKAFNDGGMDPQIGFRIPGQSEVSTEIDVIAHFTRFIVLPQGGTFRVTLRLIVEAKSLEPGAGFVGFDWLRPTEHELRVGRARCGGNPSYRVLPRFQDDQGVIIGPGGLAEAFDPINVAPVCVQWCVVRRTKPGAEQRVFADHDDSFWKGMDGVVRASDSMMVDHSTNRWPRDSFGILFEVPVLVVATPQLWLFNAVSNASPSPVPRVILSRIFQLENRTEHRLVDVVSENGLPDFMAACAKTIDALEARVAAKSHALVAIAEQQRIDLEEIELRTIAAEFRNSNSIL